MTVNSLSSIATLRSLSHQMRLAHSMDMSALRDYPEITNKASGEEGESPTLADLNPPAGLSDAARAFFLQLQMKGLMDAFEIGSEEDDVLIGGANTLIDAKGGNDKITVWTSSTVIAGDGDDVVNAWSNALVKAGDGDDEVHAWSNSYVDGGDGDDSITAWSDSRVDGGAGDDQINIGNDSSADGGDGDDILVGWSGTRIDGGNGDDMIDIWSDSTADGGSGNDVINAWVNTNISGGSGDDVLSAGGNSTISGGTGDDTISVSHDSTILFDVGDGKDAIWAGGASNTTIALGAGFSAENTTITYPTDVDFPDYSVTISFNDGSDQLTINNMTPSTELTLAFADGSSETIALPEEHKAQYGEILRAKLFKFNMAPDVTINL